MFKVNSDNMQHKPDLEVLGHRPKWRNKSGVYAFKSLSSYVILNYLFQILWQVLIIMFNEL